MAIRSFTKIFVAVACISISLLPEAQAGVCSILQVRGANGIMGTGFGVVSVSIWIVLVLRKMSTLGKVALNLCLFSGFWWNRIFSRFYQQPDGVVPRSGGGDVSAAPASVPLEEADLLVFWFLPPRPVPTRQSLHQAPTPILFAVQLPNFLQRQWTSHPSSAKVRRFFFLSHGGDTLLSSLLMFFSMRS